MSTSNLSASHTDATPVDRVLGVLVVHGNQPWQAVVADRLERERNEPGYRLIVVENGPAPMAADIARRLHAPLLELPVAGTFGAAVAAGLEWAGDFEFVLLLHDDMILDPSAVPRMVATLDIDDEIAIVGPKLLEWKRDRTVQQVGMTIDAFGRAESHIYEGEVDQGQHDHRDQSLYVSTAGMLVRTRVFRELEGFDPRFPAMRDDLDLCWRAWLAGHRVEVVPQALAWHVAAASRSVRRRGAGRRATTRYLAERHTLAAMLKNFGRLRLLWTLPLYLILAVVKVIGFLLTRRVSSAAAPLAAIAWNVRSFPGTLRLRKSVQSSRLRSDAELTDLFARGSWRTRAYADEMLQWVRGTATTALVPDDVVERRRHRSDRSILFRPFDLLRDHPVAIGGGLLLAVWLLAVLPLLGAGQLTGGQVSPWPDDGGAFWSTYVAGWGSGPLASAAFASPLQPVLWILTLLVGGAAWVGARVVVLGLVPLAWLTAVRAGRLITAAAGPRVVGATLYAGSPLLLGAFGQGRLDTLTIAALLPAALLLAARASQAGVPPRQAWRAVAGLAVLVAIMLAAAPLAWPVIGLVLLGIAVIASVNRLARAVVAVRLATAGVGVIGLLLPWFFSLLASSVARPEAFAEADLADGAMRMWQALALLPGQAYPLGQVVTVLWGAGVAAVVVAAIVFGFSTHGPTVLLFLGTFIAFAGAAAAVSASGSALVWPPIVAIPAALGIGGLGVTASRSVAGVLRAHDFGWRHGVATVCGALAAIGVLSVLGFSIADSEWIQIERGGDTVPLFVQADANRLGDYRVVLLEGDADEMRWDVVEPGGTTMVEFGAGRSREMTQALDDAIGGLLAGERSGAGLAGGLNVRYLVLRDDVTRQVVGPALADLAAVEPLSAGSGRVYELRTWLPRASVLPEAVVQEALAGQPVSPDLVEQAAMDNPAPDRFTSGRVDEGVVLVSEAIDDAWQATADGRPLARMEGSFTAAPINAFVLTEPAERVTVTAVSSTRVPWLLLQGLTLLGLLSIALRAPGASIRLSDADPEAVLPPDVSPQPQNGAPVIARFSQ